MKVSALFTGVCIVFCGTLLPQALFAQSKERTINLEMGPPLKAAVEAAKNRQFDVALAKLKEAEAKRKTAYEQFVVNQTLASIYGGQQKFAELAAIQEKLLETPQFMAPEQAQGIVKSIAQSYSRTPQTAKTIEYSKRWLQDRPNDTDILQTLGQTYYTAKDYKLCHQTFATAVSIAEKGGNKPAENWLRFSQTCAGDAGDDGAEAQAFEKLARYYPKPEYWQAYLRRMQRADKADVAKFNWLRLMGETSSLKDAEDYMIYARLAITDYGVACEAVKVLDEGFSRKILGADQNAKARQQNTLNKAKEQVQADKARLAQLATDADKDTTGQTNFDLGMIYFGCGQYDQALSNLEKSLKKGGLKEPG
ncbi:MAG TPA: tetratricopeptide repeat protein, partial [Steroidobacteraceae bacterium]|nr:tetratricopeptide repeat protein [Steroidobacteraceae bacterium]